MSQRQRQPGERPAFVLSNPAGLYDPAPNGYSHLAALRPGARLLLLAGQGGEDREGRLPADFRSQVRQAFANLLVALAMLSMIAVAASLAPLMQAGNEWARKIHVGTNMLLMTLFLWQAVTGMQIVNKLLQPEA